jgi:hypothetical protein
VRLKDYEKGFRFAIPDNEHFVNQYIRYASERTDASWEYHEALAFMLLALATQGIRWRIPAVPGGLRTNLYMLIHGRSTFSRKSTSMDIAASIQKRALPGIEIPPAFTPGAIEEIMSEHSSRPSIVWADEFTGILEKMHHQTWMAGMRAFFLTMYGKSDWEYRRTSKGTGKKKEVDRVIITDSHLCLAGNTTTTLTSRMRPEDIDDGFLARFSVIWPTSAPPKKGIADMSNDSFKQACLVKFLMDLRDMVCNLNNAVDKFPDAVVLDIAPEVIPIIDDFQNKLEEHGTRQEESVQIMLQRVADMSLKLCVLVGAGHPERLHGEKIVVTGEDARCACEVADKWRIWAGKFVDSMTADPLERQAFRVTLLLKRHGGELTRSKVARAMRMRKFHLDELQSTMLDRGVLRTEERNVGNSGRPTLFWSLPETLKEEE